MTKDQHERWKDFALRMAACCFTGNKRPSPAWIVRELKNSLWLSDFDYAEEYNSWDQDSPPLCDHVTELYSDSFPYVGQCSVCESGSDGKCSCDEKEELAYEQYDEQWLGPIRCCLRAGIDLACDDTCTGSGVLGFTAGDLRKMYPKGVPDWVSQGESRWHHFPGGELNGKFSEMSDETVLML